MIGHIDDDRLPALRPAFTLTDETTPRKSFPTMTTQPGYPTPDPLPPPPPPTPGAQPSWVGPPLVRPTSGQATAALIFGIGGLLCPFVIPSIVAVLCGHTALHETRTGQKGGHGQAVAGLILGYLVVIPAVIFGIFALIGTIVS